MFKRIITFFFVSITSLGLALPAFARVPNDPFYDRQWYLKQINAEEAWDRTTGSPAVVVAVVDTAMDIDHEDLKNNIWTNADERFGNGVDDDGNGFIDDVNGWNFLDDSNDVRPESVPPPGTSGNGRIHATLVASLIAAQGGNGTGIAGVAWHVRIMPLVALDVAGDGNTDDVAEAIRYAVDNGAHIINLSLEGYADAPDVDDAIAYARSKNVLTVAAAGNADVEEGNDLDTVKVYPVCLSNDVSNGLIGVGSTDRMDRHAPYANFGSCIQVSAPGDDVFGASPDGYEGGFSGTSLAVPLVAGAAALIKSLRPDWGWAELRERIMSSAAPVDHLQSPIVRGRIGRGRLDLEAALRDIPLSVPATSTTPAPTTSTWEVSATVAGQSTRVRIQSGVSVVEMVPFGVLDKRGARVALNDLDADGTPEVIIVPSSGRIAEWIIANADGAIRTRGTLARDVKSGLIIASVPGGAVLADPNGGRAWGIDTTGAATPFRPYGSAYRAGLDVISVPGGAAFAPRGGGGHLMVMDRKGQRLASVFPFGKAARGRWSVSTDDTRGLLLFSGPSGTREIPLNAIGPDGWQDVSSASVTGRVLSVSEGRRSSRNGGIVYDVWP